MLLNPWARGCFVEKEGMGPCSSAYLILVFVPITHSLSPYEAPGSGASFHAVEGGLAMAILLLDVLVPPCIPAQGVGEASAAF